MAKYQSMRPVTMTIPCRKMAMLMAKMASLLLHHQILAKKQRIHSLFRSCPMCRHPAYRRIASRGNSMPL